MNKKQRPFSEYGMKVYRVPLSELDMPCSKNGSSLVINSIDPLTKK